MASPEIEAQFKQVLARAQAVLKPLGFRKTGKRFWRVRDDGNLTDIGFQRSVSSDAVSIRFTANVSILSKELLRRGVRRRTS